MKHYFIIFVIFLFIACKEDDGSLADDFSLDGTTISMSDITGRWEGTKALFSKSGQGAAEELDVVAEGGYFVLEISSDGVFYATYSFPNSRTSPYVAEGLMRFDEDLLVLLFDETPEEFSYFSISHEEPNLALSGGPLEEVLDLNADGTIEDAYLELELERIE